MLIYYHNPTGNINGTPAGRSSFGKARDSGIGQRCRRLIAAGNPQMHRLPATC